MKPAYVLRSSFRLIPALCLGAAAQAASSRWTGTVDADWLNPANWTNGVPGLASPSLTSADTATFGVTTTVVPLADPSRNLFAVTFDNTASVEATGANAFVIAGGPLVFTAPPGLPSVLVSGMFGSANQTVAASISIAGSVGGNDLIFGTSNGYRGTLSIGGDVASLAVSGTTSITTRTGFNSGVNFSGIIANGAGTNVVALALATSNNGTVTLSGANTFSGGIGVNNGTLLLDYANTATVLNLSQTLTLGAGKIVFQGAPTGTSAQTMDSAAGNDLVTVTGTGSTLVVDNHGGAGTTLTLGNTWVRNSASTLLFDISSGSTIVSNPPLRNGIATNNATSGSAGFFVKDSTGTGFATVSGGNLVRFTGATTLTGTGGATGNFKTTGFTLTGVTNFNTLELDASNAADTRILDLGANNLSPQNAVGLLVTGAHAFTVTGSGMISNNSIIYHAGTGTLLLQVGSTTSGTTKAGPGFAIFEKDFVGTTLSGGITRMAGTATGGTGSLTISSGAVMEIGTYMNGATAGDFTRLLGTGAGQVQIIGNGGYSAFGGTRIVNIGGASAAVAWGSATNNLTNGVFILSSEKSDSTLEFQNPISFSAFDRAIQVNDGSAAIDARLTGALSSGGSNAGLYKTGLGTLELAAANGYTGNTRVDAGRLLLTGSLSGTNAVILATGATLELGSADRINDAAKFRLEGGTFSTAGFNETLGVMTLAGSATLDLGGGASILRFSDSNLVSWNGALNITHWDGSAVGGGLDQVYFGFTDFTLTAAQVDLIHFIDPLGFAPGTYPADLLPTGEVVATIPEPASATALLGGLGLLLLSRRFRRGD